MQYIANDDSFGQIMNDFIFIAEKNVKIGSIFLGKVVGNLFINAILRNNNIRYYYTKSVKKWLDMK